MDIESSSEFIGRLPENPYSLSDDEKIPLFVSRLLALTKHHRDACANYNELYRSMRYWSSMVSNVKDPFSQFLPLPVEFFKTRHLQSVREEAIIARTTSSGTSGTKSRVMLDRETSNAQRVALGRILSHSLGMPKFALAIAGSKPDSGGQHSFSAREAAYRGFAICARRVIFLFDKEGHLVRDALDECKEIESELPLVLFGFTADLYLKLLPQLLSVASATTPHVAVIVHGGGWKSLEKLRVGNQEFSSTLRRTFGPVPILDYYGLIEQPGGIYMQCDSGYYHASDYSYVRTRDQNLEFQAFGKAGLLQVFSLIPVSYPGHSLLTGDLGTIHGVDDCECGRLGQRISIQGRISQLPSRGCSDASS